MAPEAHGGSVEFENVRVYICIGGGRAAVVQNLFYETCACDP